MFSPKPKRKLNFVEFQRLEMEVHNLIDSRSWDEWRRKLTHLKKSMGEDVIGTDEWYFLVHDSGRFEVMLGCH